MITIKRNKNNNNNNINVNVINYQKILVKITNVLFN